MSAIMLRAALAVLAASALLPFPASAQDEPLSLRNNFRIGNAGVLCTAQSTPTDRRLTGMFDRAFALTCRDAAGTIGSIIAARSALDLIATPGAMATGPLACGTEELAKLDGVGDVRTVVCSDPASHVDYRRYLVRRGKTSYFVEGLAGYDPALKIALASIIADKPLPGDIRVATTEVGDAAAFARIQAGALDPAGARNEAYSRNGSGKFAESAEFFDALAQRERAEPQKFAEALANQGLQLSNLGSFAAARDSLDRAAREAPRGDGVLQRLIRNYRAIDLLNQRRPREAIAVLATPVAAVEADEDREDIRQGLISPLLSSQINRGNSVGNQLGRLDGGLTPAERATLLDGQALALRAKADRNLGRLDESSRQLANALAQVAAVRDGKVTSAASLRTEIQIEQAAVAEARGQRQLAAATYDEAIAAIGAAYPDSPAELAAKARKASFLARTGDPAGATALFKEIVERSSAVSDSGPALRDLLLPYFKLLADSDSADAPAAMFRLAQVLQRPGVAQTQAVLARQLSQGNDDASALFRLSLARTRQIARTESEISRLTLKPAPTAAETEALSAAQGSLAVIKDEQSGLLSRLSTYPRFKALAPQIVELTELQAGLRAGEAYYRMMMVGDVGYAIFATGQSAKAFRIANDRSQLEAMVHRIRTSISRVENGQTLVSAFEADAARSLYMVLFGPIDSEVRAARHLIFEPDGPMLQLPPSLLIAAQKGLDAYKERLKRPDADEYDMTGIDWFGRGKLMSISVSPRSFLDVRTIAPSKAPNAYLGLGENAPALVRPTPASADGCDWPIATWQAPTSAAELRYAQSQFGADRATLITGTEFADTALLADKQLDRYRILHFATHGLVTAPRPECLARPALVTSFGAQDSDGLLTFREIFDLKLDADLVILSACDTAGAATVSASLDAGVATGGGYALDGLVRAFIGAGARSVVASHWPVPDDYDATNRLMSGLVKIGRGEPLAASLARAEQGLMDDAQTSHPFYWAAFIILGDGDKPLLN